MAHWHSRDLTDFDLVPVARTAQRVSGAIGRRAVDTAREATYITVGFGLLAFQRAQVQRREFEKSRQR
jgi:hypothetical protein